MSKVKYYIMIIFMSLIIFLIPNASNAAVEVTRNVYSNNCSMKFTFTGLELDLTHEYEYGFTPTSATQVEDWFLITEYKKDTAVVDLITTTDEIRDVINKTDTGYITIRDKNTSDIIVEPYAVDLKIPYLSVTNYIVLENGKEFGSYQNECINVGIRNAAVSEAYYQYEEITDKNIIDRYKEIKSKNGDFMELESLLKTTPPTSSWSTWSYWNGHGGDGLNGYGITQDKISVPGEGLYYMWVYFSGKNIKNVYGCILVDNIQSETENNNQNQNNNNNQNNGNNQNSGETTKQNNIQVGRNDSTTAGKILPKAGSSLMIIVGIVIFIIITVGLYIKNKQYKGIK